MRSGDEQGDEEDDERKKTGGIGLEDHTREEGEKDGEGKGKEGRGKRGIEGCVGNTPMILIGSLSREIGCEVWGKVEVSFFLSFGFSFFLLGGGGGGLSCLFIYLSVWLGGFCGYCLVLFVEGEGCGDGGRCWHWMAYDVLVGREGEREREEVFYLG